MSDIPEDVYPIKSILKRFNIEDEQLCEALVEQCYRVYGSYIEDIQNIKNGMNGSISTCLKLILHWDDDGKKPLRKSVEDLAKQLESYSRKGC